MRILVVEDEPRLLRNLAKALREAGYAVDTAEAGDDGLFKAETNDYMAESARACVELIHPLADARGIQIHFKFGPAKVLGDAARVRQVVTNLLTNAIQYNQSQGQIQVRTGVENGRVILTVTDTGPGIAPEDLPHIFERFYRSDKARTSANGRNGLGLAICEAVVDEHFGSIEATNQPDAGATFTVRLPAAPSP